MATFIYPCKGVRLTSGFGYRTHPVTGEKLKMHKGIDLANPGTINIVAVAAGTVRYAQEMSGYGYVVILRHSINGKRMDTVYAHLRKGSIAVAVGQSVKQGAKLGLMGNTGVSTGQHLHFELHDGEWKAGQPNAINPLPYLDGAAAATTAVVAPVTQGESLVDYLEKQGKASSFTARKALAIQYGIQNYVGTASQNEQLLQLVKNASTVKYKVKTGTVKTEAALKTLEKVIRKQYPNITLTASKSGKQWCYVTGAFGSKADAESFVSFFKAKGYTATIEKA